MDPVALVYKIPRLAVDAGGGKARRLKTIVGRIGYLSKRVSLEIGGRGALVGVLGCADYR